MTYQFKKILILALILLAVLVAGVWWWLSSSSVIPGLTRDPGLSSPLMGEDQGGGEVVPATYDNPADDFTFTYPGRFTITETPFEGGGKQITVESTEPKKGFELTILPFDEPGPLTSERIRQDLPDLPMDNLQYLIFSPLREGETQEGVNIPALSFNSTDDTIGPTYEIWFSYNGYLYQSLTYPEFASGMQDILGTWSFK